MPDSPSERARLNFRLGLANGAIFRITLVLLDSEMVVTWFLTQLGVANILIGLVPSIRMGSSFLLQLLVSGRLQQRPYKLPFYRAMAVTRFLLLLGLALAIWLIPTASPWLIPAFFALLIAYSMGAGLTGIPFMDIVAKVIPPTRRGTFFAQRAFWGGLVALSVSVLVGYVLGEPQGLAFPRNIALLIALAAVTLAIAAAMWSMVREPASAVAPGTSSWAQQVKAGIDLLRVNEPYRVFVLSRLATQLAQSAGPFYIVYARDALHITPGMIGVYLAARTAAQILSNLFWGRISDRGGNRRLFRIANAVGALMPLSALLVGWANSTIPGASPLLSWAYIPVFVASGAFAASLNIARPGYLLDIAPAEQRSLYLGFTNTLFGIATFVSAIGGLILDWAGFGVLFGLSAAFFGVALLLSLRMAEPRELSRASAAPTVPDRRLA